MGNYNAVNITLDVFSAVITIMIGVYLLGRRNNAKENRYFFWMCVWNLLFIIGDLSDWCCNGLGHLWYPVVLHVGTFLYYVAMVPLVYMTMKYVVEYLSAYGAVPKWYIKTTRVVAVIHLAGCVLTPFTEMYYGISADNIYYRGPYVLLASVLPVLIYLFVMLLTFQFRKRLSPRAIIALLSYVWFPLFGQVVQNLFRGVATLNPAITLAILFIFFNIQLDREVQYEKNKQKLTEANIKIMMSQIQPHFLYNTLAMIRGLCTTAPEKAKEAINDFSTFLRMNMDSLTNELSIPMEQELTHVKSYLNLVQQMYGDNIRVEYDICATKFRIPALSLQPLVENSVHKGLRKKEGGGTVKISTREKKGYYEIVIKDDGVGFSEEILKEKGHIGIYNVRSRLEAICGGRLRIESMMGTGTTVTVTIPKTEEKV